MTKVLTTRERNVRYGQVRSQLTTRLLSADINAECKLQPEPRRRRDRCSACSTNTGLKIDNEIARLIRKGVIAAPARCPYLEFTRALVVALLVGPGAKEAAKESHRTRIIELTTALRHIDRALKTLSRKREDIKYLAAQSDNELLRRLADVVTAETFIADAVNFFIENTKRYYGEDLTKPRRSRRGHPGFRDIQGIVGTCAYAWKELTGKRPGKNNVNFHGLLHAAAETVLGPLDPEPDWEWQILAARKRERGWKSGQKSKD
jgi:hypothetical protein